MYRLVGQGVGVARREPTQVEPPYWQRSGRLELQRKVLQILTRKFSWNFHNNSNYSSKSVEITPKNNQNWWSFLRINPLSKLQLKNT